MTQQRNEFTGLFTRGNYKTKLHDVINDLYAKVKTRPIQETIEDVRLLTDTYVEETGERPDTLTLDRMASLILRYDLTDPTPWKTRNTEYPTESDRQIKDYYSGLQGNIPETMASDKTVHELPTRRERTWYENTYVESRTKARNKERRKRYNAFKRGDIPGVLNVKINKEES